MSGRLLHTPEGVRDIYNEECERKLRLQKELLSVLHGYGYRDIETPTFEFFDVFSRDVGTISSRELYKFFDREGNTLVLRPDITPSIARAVSKYFSQEEGAIRLCYQGNTFVNNSSYQGLLKENTHIGAELIGENHAQADAEIIAMVVDALKASGLEEFQISVGQVEFFKSILRPMNLEEELVQKLRDYISNRNLFGVQTLLSGLEMEKESRAALEALPSLYGQVEVLERAQKLACNEEAYEAVQRLREIYEIAKEYGITKYISFDLSLLSRYDYYTGIFFRGYTFGTGDAVVKGGRYDGLLRHFGKDAPSIGFVVVANRLLSALERQGISQKAEAPIREIVYDKTCQSRAICLAKILRAKGERVALNYMECADETSRQSLEELCRKYEKEMGA